MLYYIGKRRGIIYSGIACNVISTWSISLSYFQNTYQLTIRDLILEYEKPTVEEKCMMIWLGGFHCDAGFEVVDEGCCGTGLIEGAITCNAFTPVCSHPSKYVFWDVIHPTQRSYYFLFQSVRPVVDYFLHKLTWNYFRKTATTQSLITHWGGSSIFQVLFCYRLDWLLELSADTYMCHIRILVFL